jgi:RHS repeat-associated protein
VPGVESLGFGYDKSDRITSLTNGIDTDQSEAFDYDDQSRLTGVYGGSDTESYSYDADGNRLTQTINGTSASFTYSDTSNRLMGISGAVTMSYGYDAQGNTTTENNTATYGYDPFNRLSSAGSATDYVGPEGQRLRKITGSGTTYFAPDAGGPLLAEDDNGSWVDYVWLNGRLVGRIAGTTVDAIHDDQTGRPQMATDASGAVVWKATNYTFEREVTQDNIGGLNLGFPGQYYDSERGLWNNGHRDYSASLGRYLEYDPSGLNGGVNGYVYVDNNPIMGVDPYGLWDWPALPQGVVDASAGFGDALSFGITGWARGKLGIGSVDECSASYKGGQVAGIVAGFVDGEGEAELLALNKSLASESQVAELLAGKGVSIAGAGTDSVLRQAERLANDYGGTAEGWQKVTSWNYTASDGVQFETHAYRNISTGQVVESKTVFPRGF